VIRAQCQEKTGEKEMFSDVDGRQTEKKVLGCRMAGSQTFSVIYRRRLRIIPYNNE